MTLDDSNPNIDTPTYSGETCDILKGVCHTSIPKTRLIEGIGSEILEIIDSTLGVGISILDQDYRYKFINKLVYKQLQIKEDELVVGDSFDKSIQLVCSNFDVSKKFLYNYHPKHINASGNDLLDSEIQLPLIKYPDGSIQKIVIKKLQDGQSICLNYDVSELHNKNNILKKSLDIGKAGYCNFDFQTKKYDISESIVNSVPEKYRKKILRQGLWAIVHPQSVDALKKAYRDIPKNKGKLRVSFRTRNGLWIKADGFAEKENGQWSILRIFLSDVTKSRRQKKEMEAAKNQAVAATIAKSQFLANMSHEIRTPMNGVMGMSELLSRRNLGPEEHKMVKIISRSANSLLEIINDILDFSKIEADALELESISVDIESMLTDIIGLLHTVATDKDIDLRLIMPNDIPRHFLGDSVRLRQIVLNLVGNALKFTKKGSVTIKVSWNHTEDESSKLSISILDTGIGMKEDVVANIFDQFSQADNSTTRQYGGTGLGLSITKRIVELMGGSISVKSVFEEGSNFTVVLPLMPAEVKGQISEKPRSSLVQAPTVSNIDTVEYTHQIPIHNKVDILVADDQELNRNVMKLMLAETRFAPIFANNGSEAVARYCENPERFAAILMDISMPVMDGIEAAARIFEFKNSRELQHTPVIAVTGHSHKYTREICLKAKMDDYMLKPVKRSVLVPKLEQWVQKSFEHDHGLRSQLLQTG